MKKLVLKIMHANWSRMGPGDWNHTEWKIYNDYTVEIKISHNSIDMEEQNIIKKCRLTEDNYDHLFEKIQLAKENNDYIDGCDGSAWEIIQYDNDNVVWKRDLGYIDGILPLEEIAMILNHLIKDESNFI